MLEKKKKRKRKFFYTMGINILSEVDKDATPQLMGYG